MSMFVLRRSGIPVTVWLGTNIVESPIIPYSDNTVIETTVPSLLKQERIQYGVEESANLYRMVINYFLSLRKKRHELSEEGACSNL